MTATTTITTAVLSQSTNQVQAAGTTDRPATTTTTAVPSQTIY